MGPVRPGFYVASCITVSIAVPSHAQLSYGADLTLAPHYVWRGRTLDGGWMALPDAYLSTAWCVHLRTTAGVWSTVEVGSRDSNSLRLHRRWLGETDPWLEVAVSGPVDLAAGWTRDVFPAGSLPNGSEVYATVQDLELPVIVPRIGAWWSTGAGHERYVEAALPVRVPLWTGVLIPVGSILVTPIVGYNASRTSSYFARRGFTHFDVSMALTIGAVGMGRFSNALRVEYHWQRSYDPRTKLVSVNETRLGRSWIALQVSVSAPRCGAPQELCTAQ